mmetsp:Transcript_7384/g.11197  ORF Transcript_7384/g.11197 Transcript_7384/m.11197 type:complete len:519 (-) Transcript_7384:168-1724(-)|eukprot:CAMPEP_0195292616 /NCGR_PEP_ID=MMETSP0707-20130614/10293_1 /TAXON_ID=33640 /ORGANISM="Asterionellopsis glacialis, Strain CCMP134" /LENGTH=518 /DNA_ID=CAMNT_0040353127 /DNA_START=270 /DNA_END=1826 /DNA_ORIENTATION=+
MSSNPSNNTTNNQRMAKPSLISKKPSPIGSAVSAAPADNTNNDRFPQSRIEMPSLLAGLNVPDILKGNAPSSIQTPWKVNDATLPPIPPFYPPLDPNCSTHVMDATPSVVVARIAKCLQNRSISVEYDDEMNTATCMTCDRVHFVVHLYRGDSNPPPPHEHDMESPPDLKHAVIVECLRTRGNPISFHEHCRSILNTAMAMCDGSDARPCIQTCVTEFARLKRKSSDERLMERPAKRRANSTQTALLSVERSLSLLQKDRLGAQRLGMESVVMLTDERCSGMETAVFCALAIVGAPVTADLPKDYNNECLHNLHDWIMSLVQERVTPIEIVEDVNIGHEGNHANDIPAPKSLKSAFYDDDSDEQQKGTLEEASPITRSDFVSHEDAHHGGTIRAMALRAFANSLSILSREQSKLLKSILLMQSPQLVSKPLLMALAEDLSGSVRPPTAVTGTRLASQHEAALAAICIGILADHSAVAKRSLAKSKHLSVVGTLEKARDLSRHDVLSREAGRALEVLGS